MQILQVLQKNFSEKNCAVQFANRCDTVYFK